MQIQESGVATAIESIYRDLEYARSLIKRTVVEDVAEEEDNEHSTIRNRDPAPGHARSPSSTSGHSSTASLRAAPSEDWSVISDQEDQDGERNAPEISPSSEGRGIKHSPSKRTSIAAAMLSVLPDL
jgi:sterol 3beta-glucosyltransferase